MHVRPPALLLRATATLALALAALPAPAAQPGGPVGPGPDDTFTPSDRAAAPDYKTPCYVWGRPAESTPAAQLARARRFERARHFGSARKAYDALVHNWGASPEAAEAQLAVASLRERERDWDDAFREYQYYLERYAQSPAAGATYAAVVASQYAVANELRAKIGGGPWSPSTEMVASMYRHIVANAPDAAFAPAAVFAEGDCYERSGEWEKAIVAFERLPAKYPSSPLATDALLHAAGCRYRLARRHPNDERTRDHAIEGLRLALRAASGRPEAVEVSAKLDELVAVSTRSAFEKAAFYDRVRHNDGAAAVAYREFLRLHPSSAEAPLARARLAELSARAGGAPAFPDQPSPAPAPAPGKQP